MRRDDGGALLPGPFAARRSPGALNVIVAATDFTPAANAAARRGAQLAHAGGARLALLHVMTAAGRMVAPLLDVLGVTDRCSPGAALSRLRQSAARLMSELEVSVDTHLASGSAPAAIAAHAQAARADLVVLGNRQGSFLVDLLRINTAHRVRQRVSIPVLAVSRPAERPYARILLAADLSPDAAHAGRVARRLFPEAQLHVLHVCEPVYEGVLNFAGVGEDVVFEYRRRALEEAARQLRLFARDAGLGEDAALEVRLGHPAACIRERARELAADVVVLRPAKSWLARGMADSVTEQLLADPPCDALLVS